MPRGAREITLRFLAAPTDAGYSGTVGGGRVLEWIDKAGYAAAAGWSGTYSVTAYVGNVRFTRPVDVGDLVEATARVIHTGTTSMHILVTVSAGNPGTATCGRRRTASWSSSPSTRTADRPRCPARSRGRARPRVAGERRTPDRSAQRDRRSHGRPDLQRRRHRARVVLRFLAAPTDVNWGGKVHGGIVMRWIDEAAHVLATQWTGSASNVAVYVGRGPLLPAAHGSATSWRSRRACCSPGPRSMHISVHVRSGDPVDPGPRPDDPLAHRLRPARRRRQRRRCPPVDACQRGGRGPARPRAGPRRDAQRGRRRAPHPLTPEPLADPPDQGRARTGPVSHRRRWPRPCRPSPTRPAAPRSRRPARRPWNGCRCRRGPG